jgi:hypothetical protein
MKRRKTGDGIKTGVCANPREESGGSYSASVSVLCLFAAGLGWL